MTHTPAVRDPATSTVPTTATPSAEPTWRPVEAMPAATPACARGMPVTAVLVIGAFTSPKPIPNVTYAVNRTGSGVSASRPVSRKPPAASAIPAGISGARGPMWPTRYPDSGAKNSVMPAIGSRYRPASSADSPRVSWRYSVLRNRKPPSAANAATAITKAPVNGALRKNRSSSSGSRRRGSYHSSVASAARATAKHTSSTGEPQPS